MKTFITAILLGFLSFSSKSKSWEVYRSNNNDTINRIDVKGLKQGQWIVFGRSIPRSGYQFDHRMEEGKYIDDMKTGTWVTYYRDEHIKTKINYSNGRPDGYAAIYNIDGKIIGEGFWKDYKWIPSINSYANK